MDFYPILLILIFLQLLDRYLAIPILTEFK